MSRKRKLSLAAALCVSLLPAPSPANEPDDLPGTGCLRTDVDGTLVDIPLKRTSFHADVAGPVARVRVTQTFTNPYQDTIEAVYAFPMPHQAAVSDFEMRIGSRRIEGDIERREEARRMYEEAKNSGHVAALLEQNRPNVFTQSVANILPGNDIDVTITYVETVRYQDGAWDLAFPTVVGPRFNPPGFVPDVVPASERAGDDFFRSLFRRDPDPDRLENPPVLPPGARSSHDLEVRVDWNAGIPIDRIESPTHRIDVTRRGGSRASIVLHPLDSIPNKDFVLRCRPRGDGPEAGVVAYHDGRDGYVSVIVHPKLDLRRADVTSKEMVFVLDCSGSMSGEPIAAAKALVRHALRHVNEGDTFQIIRFSENASGFAPRPIAATTENVKRGIAYLDQLEGEGGTMMIEGIKAALDFPRDPGRLRLVMFLTDGYIGNEAQILEAVRARIGGARLFSFGVGSSVNRHLLDEMSREGRGEVQYFLPGSSVPEEVARFYDRIRNPYLTDVELVWHGASVDDRCPPRVPDLFGGAPLSVHARYERADSDAWLEVRGRLAGRPWKQRVPLDLPRSEAGNPAVGALWARAKIAQLERTDLRGERADVAEEITRLALAHEIVTKYTSFVAIEERLVVSDGRPRTIRVPVEMPEGVSYEGIFGTENEGLASGSIGGRAMPQSAPSSRGFLSAEPPTRATERREALDKSVALTPPALGNAREEDGRARPDSKTSADARSNRGIGLVASLDRGAIRAGETLVLTLVLENASGRDLLAPEALTLADLRIRVIDSAWNETIFGAKSLDPRRPSSAWRNVAPGDTRRFSIRLTAADAPFLVKEGVYHLIVDGGVLGAGSSNRVTVRVGR
jgi:Ca-activated chloride channel family protein